ncbi:hypothetical protein K501DRAFT_270919 [Backusella circina FSU 941]|nr:hypothetical protein K501DRAFT_270919 [Backusella circina FSU 941]
MTESPNVEQQPRSFTEEEVLELLRRAQYEEKPSTQERERRELPVAILTLLEVAKKNEQQENFELYKRDFSRYHNEDWTVAEDINKSFIPKLKHFNVDTNQIVNNCYKGAEICRTQARAASVVKYHINYDRLNYYIIDQVKLDSSEIYEQLFTINAGQLSVDEAQQLMDETIENAKKFAVSGWANARYHEDDAREYATKALRLPPSLKHMENKESANKREAFSQEFVQQYNEAKYQQRCRV